MKMPSIQQLAVPKAPLQRGGEYSQAPRKKIASRGLFFPRRTSIGRSTDEKENEIFIIYKEIQMGSGAKSEMRNGFLIYEEMCKYLTI
jgi:hypothetical protein